MQIAKFFHWSSGRTSSPIKSCRSNIPAQQPKVSTVAKHE